MHTPRSWDIFCRVVDNFGDAGVCWRLARRLAQELGQTVRLWIDDLEVLRKLQPELTDSAEQTIDGVRVVQWSDTTRFADVDLVDIVVEGFGCGLPDDYVEALARSSKRKIWIVLEYLSAEPWVPEHHGLPSPHPRLPIERYFFFPGFSEGTGGLLREQGLLTRRDAFGETRRDAFWASIGLLPPERDADVVSIFGYEDAPLVALLQHWQHATRRTVAAIPEGALARAALGFFGVGAVPADRVIRRGSVEVRFVPWLPQPRYDELLWSCDFNFVRGEDSFVRAQWAARPFVWHIYAQDEAAHAKKLDAFLDVYCEGLGIEEADAVRGLMATWNRLDGGAVTPGAAWNALAAHRSLLRAHAQRWAARIGGLGELAENLASFCRDKLK